MRNNLLPRGITFIEFMVVLLVIVIAVAIFFPFGHRGDRESPRQTQCINNLKQITTALMMYCQDDHDCYPPTLSTDTIAWPLKMTGVDPKVYDCPDSSFKGSDIAPDYGYNAMVGSSVSGGKTRGVALGDITYPSSCPVVTDVVPGGPHTGGGKYNNYAIYDWNEEIDNRHKGGVVIGYADGHVAWTNMRNIPDHNNQLSFLFSQSIDPYLGCGTIVYEGADGQLAAKPDKSAAFAKGLAKPLRVGGSVGIVGEFRAKDWGTVEDIALVLGEKGGPDLHIGLDAANITAGVSGMPNASLAHGKTLNPGIWYKLRAYIIAGKLYAYLTDNKTPAVCISPTAAAPSADQISLRLRAAPGKPALVEFRGVHVYRYDIP